MNDVTRADASPPPNWLLALPSPLSVEAGIYYVLAAVWLLLAGLTVALGVPDFLAPGNIANILYQASLVALLAVPMTLLLISGNFDLSVGANAALCAATVLLLNDSLGPLGAVAATVACGALVGLVNGLTVQKLGINAFIVTLGMATFLRGALLVMTGGRSATSHYAAGMADLRAALTGEWVIANPLLTAGAVLLLMGLVAFARRQGTTRWAGLVVTGVIVLLAGTTLPIGWILQKCVCLTGAAAAAAWLVTERTIIGRRLQAVGSNSEAARLVGIRIDRYKVVPFALNGVAAAAVGIMFAARLGSVLPSAMSGMELTTIAAAILGGTSLFGGSGSVLRSVAGAILLYSLLNGFDILGLGASYQGVVEGIVLVAAAAMYTARPKRA